ncbi:MAG: outer membrane lipoprotein-sorting protein [Spirochaetes bacterium]|nr:outer membrane lipoprotein-sorting protein [Spirochaetota bacterium]
MPTNKIIKRCGITGLVLAVLFINNNESISQEDRKIELNAQGILARVDKMFEYPPGNLKGVMKHIRPDGSAATISINGRISQEDYLFTFSSRERGDQLKVLYNLGGEDIWVYNIHSLKLFHKLSIDKYDEILSTNFTFLDMSNADFQSNYTASISGDAFVKGNDVWKLILKPIAKGGMYGMLTLYVTKDRFIPVRIDYHDRDKAIFKFMTVVRIKENNGRIIPLRYDMMNIRQGTVTIISFTEMDDGATFDSEIFRSEKLGS